MSTQYDVKIGNQELTIWTRTDISGWGVRYPSGGHERFAKLCAYNSKDIYRYVRSHMLYLKPNHWGPKMHIRGVIRQHNDRVYHLNCYYPDNGRDGRERCKWK